MSGRPVSSRRTCWQPPPPILGALLALIALAFARPVQAQQYRLFEASLGAVLVNNDYPGARHTATGVNWGFAFNVRPNVRIFLEYAEQWHPGEITYEGERLQFDEKQFVGGAEWVVRQWSPRARPFLRAVLGVAGRAYKTPTRPDDPEAEVLANDFGVAVGFGAGVDVPLSRRVALRAAQLDVLLTHLSHVEPQYSVIRKLLPTLDTVEYNFRFAVGVVLGWGPAQAPTGLAGGLGSRRRCACPSAEGGES